MEHRPSPIGFGSTTEYLSLIGSGRRVVAVANTAIALTSSETATGIVEVQALYTNASYATTSIMVGDSIADVTAGSENGIELQPGEPHDFPIRNAAFVYIDGATAGLGVSYLLYG